MVSAVPNSQHLLIASRSSTDERTRIDLDTMVRKFPRALSAVSYISWLELDKTRAPDSGYGRSDTNPTSNT